VNNVIIIGSLINCLNFVCRTRGIHGSFTNEDEGEQIAAEADISSDGGISSSFKNAKKGKQNFEKAKISWYCVYNMLLDMCLIGHCLVFALEHDT